MSGPADEREPQKASAVTLRALEGQPLGDERIRSIVVATAHAIAERHGIAVLDVTTQPDRITVTLDAGRIASMGFAAELRRLTSNWHRGKFGVDTLWGKPPADVREDDEGEAWKKP